MVEGALLVVPEVAAELDVVPELVVPERVVPELIVEVVVPAEEDPADVDAVVNGPGCPAPAHPASRPTVTVTRPSTVHHLTSPAFDDPTGLARPATRGPGHPKDTPRRVGLLIDVITRTRVLSRGPPAQALR
jgi:hypothetical protein